jgi:alpha-tubulin suppressor-like RCC1 family protein
MATVPVKGLDDKKIVQIACGQQHSIALDDEGYELRYISGSADS